MWPGVWLLLGCGEPDPCKDVGCGVTAPQIVLPLLVCDEQGWETPDAPLQAFCVGCVELECRWDVLASSEIVRVELDLYGTAPEWGEWSEFHDRFALVAEGPEGLWRQQLHRISDIDLFESGTNSLLWPESGELSFSFSAVDTEGTYVDCAWSGVDASLFEDCRPL